MITAADIELRWPELLQKLASKLGDNSSLNDVLLFIGIRESGLPPKQFSEKEKAELMQMATCTILVPARYYELMWVEDTGWPHYKQLQRLPQMNDEEKEKLFKQFILMYAEKNRLI
ncbi:MAG: hypothetical protein QM725_13895 [Lacibacter sp.]